MKEIDARADVESLVDDFYQRLLGDERIAPVFAGIELETHLPVIVNFWMMILFGEDVYRGNTFQRHLHLPIEDRHFDVWLGHWIATIDARFTGERAQVAKTRAQSVAAIFRGKFRAVRET